MSDRPFELPEDATSPRVCYCMHVHEATLRRAIEAGFDDVEKLRAVTRAGTGCGTCRWDLLDLLRRMARACRNRPGSGTP